MPVSVDHACAMLRHCASPCCIYSNVVCEKDWKEGLGQGDWGHGKGKTCPKAWHFSRNRKGGQGHCTLHCAEKEKGTPKASL